MAVTGVSITANTTYPAAGKWRIQPSGPNGGRATIQIQGTWDSGVATLKWSALGTTFTSVPVSASDATAVTISADGIFNVAAKGGYVQISMASIASAAALTLDGIGIVAE